jgi:hypothetical protein
MFFLQSRINYFCREKYYRAMQQTAVTGLKKFSGDPVYKFFYGLSLILEGRVQEGIRELDRFQVICSIFVFYNIAKTSLLVIINRMILKLVWAPS